MAPCPAWACLLVLLIAALAPPGAEAGLLSRRQSENPPGPQKPSLGAGAPGGDAPPPWHAQSVGECLGALGCGDTAAGLDAVAVSAALEVFGPNELKAAKATPLWKLFAAQFDDALVKVSKYGPSTHPQSP
ncbi:hypothetical protein T492DRAFT_355764 [Pavlovales sp. CCMP2436]|nr:hypothetical protein T492DRAFT_355764 [Pavlovales sp. CCMP2436]